MELLTCPACGCSVQVADVLLGRCVRCFACRHSFVAAAKPAESPPVRLNWLPPVRPTAPQNRDEDSEPNEVGPYCPGCGRGIAWSDPACPYCGEELEAEDAPIPAWRRAGDLIRRDHEPHRGALILCLGNISMFVGGLSLCTFGLGSAIGVPIGIIAWRMANRDLQRMQEYRMDARGKAQTQTGRTAAIAGVILGLICASFFALVYLAGRRSSI